MTDTYACGITMHRPEGDLFEILFEGNEYDETDEKVIKFQGAHLQEQGRLTPDASYAWKALSDPFYRALYRDKRSTAALYRAGFFDDGLPQLVEDYGSWDHTFATTAVEKVRKNTHRFMMEDDDRPFAVLLTTGGFAPIHNGHVEMMEKAKAKLEDQGYKVVGGFFAPGHDSYVGKKYGGTAAIPAVHRCAMVDLACEDSDWLACDPWAARYMPAELNFTDIVWRMTVYLSHHLNVQVKVFYVYGSDNEGFGDVLWDRSVMVDRSELSSKMAREGNQVHLHPKVREYLNSWQDTDTCELPYLIRNEEDDSLQHWTHLVPIEELTKRRIQLQSAVRLGIAQLFKNAGTKHKVHLLSVNKQRELANEAIGDRKSLSLDPFFNATARIDSTRYFALSDPQYKPLIRAERPGCEKLEQQASIIPDGEYVLVEDDTVTGGTILTAKALLRSSVKIVDQVILSDYADYKGVEYFDVVDLRDFIFGSLHGGLGVITFTSNKARAPYVLPYVSLRSRAKIPAEMELELSLIIWQANYKFFKDTGILLRDTHVGFLTFARSLKFSTSMSMEDFCSLHLRALLESING